MPEVFLGIDLGTTTTLIGSAVQDENAISVRVLPIRQNDGRGGQKELRYLPSVAFFPRNTQDALVGLEAQVRGPEEDASRYVRAVKRQMGRRILLPEVNQEPADISARYLSYALREGRRNLPLEQMVFTVTVPASFTTNQRADTLLALRKACEEAKTPYPEADEGQLFISEPVAAILAFLNKEFSLPESVRKLDLSKTNRVIVYDIGGGTLDLTLVFIEPKRHPAESLIDLNIHVDAIGYYNPFGGEDFDLAMAQELHRRLLEKSPELRSVVLNPAQRLGIRLQLMNAAKRIKEKLSALMDQPAPGFLGGDAEVTSHFYHDQINVRGQEYALEGEITVSDYLEVIEPLIRPQSGSRKNLIRPLSDLLQKTGFDAADLDGLLIVGGMGRMPIVMETVLRFWANERVWLFNPPDHAVVTGAAIYSYLRRRHPDFSLQEPAADAYYVLLKDGFDLILPSKASQGERRQYKLDSDTDSLLLQIFAGEEPEAGKPIETIYPTLIHQGGTTIKLERRHAQGTEVWVQMRYETETGQDHTKVPWVCVWVGDCQGRPLFQRRYSELTGEVRHE